MRSMNTTRAGAALWVAALLGAACGSQEGAAPAAQEDEQAICAEAAAHVQTCFPDAEIGTPEACDPAQAADLISRPCEELQAVDANKADGLCAPWLWWTWQSCLPSGGGGGATAAQPLYVSLSTCDDDFCLGTLGGGSCALVTLEDASGEEVARGYTNTNSSARFEGLAPGVYTVKVWTREDELAEQMVSEGLALSGRAPATQEVAVEVSDENALARFYFERGVRETLERCAAVSGTVAGVCDGAPMEEDEVEWTWFVRIQGENVAGELEQLTRPLKIFEVGNQYRFTGLLPGTYTVTLVELEVPSYQRRPNPDYQGLAERYATGVEVEVATQTFTLEDALTEAAQGEVEVTPSWCE